MLFAFLQVLFAAWALYLMWKDYNLFWQNRSSKHSVRRLAIRFCGIVSGFFDVQGTYAALDYMATHMERIERYVEFICRTYAPELLPHKAKYVWVLLYRRDIFAQGTVAEAGLADVSAACHRYFMGMAMQLRMYGEIQHVGAVESWRREFANFVTMYYRYDLVAKLEEVGCDIRTLELDLAKASEHDAGDLRTRLDACVDNVKKLISSEAALIALEGIEQPAQGPHAIGV